MHICYKVNKVMYGISFFCCVKYFTIIFSCLYWILGSSIIVGSIWILNDPLFSLVFTQSGEVLHVLIYLILLAGCFILLSAWFACYGILKRSKCILGAFIITLSIILGFEVAAGTWIFKNKDRFNDVLRASIKYSIQEEYGQISTTTVTFDVIQKHFKCCGADGPTDWISSRYNNVGREDVVNIAISSLNIFFSIPESCCNHDINELTCEIARKNKLDAIFQPGVYEEGCINKLEQIARDNSVTLFTASIIVIILEITALLFSLYFCVCIVKKRNKNKGFPRSY